MNRGDGTGDGFAYNSFAPSSATLTCLVMCLRIGGCKA